MSATVTFSDCAGFSAREIVEIIGLGLATVGGAFGIATYFRDVRQKQTDWLYQLFEKFYEKPTYKQMRRALDCEQGSEDELRRLKEQIASPENGDLEEDFADYLNFFEFIVRLVKRNRMQRKDMEAMFAYYLDKLGEHEFVRQYVGAEGFEALDEELRRRHIKA
jgi:hypothetical protein